MKRLLLVLGLIVLLFSNSQLTHAAGQPATGLQIFPLRSRPTQAPGDTSSGKVTVKNDTDQNMSVNIHVEKFKVIDEDYNYDFSSGEHTDWVRLADKTVELKKRESKEIAYSLAVPIDAPPGGYYFSILASIENPNSSSNFKKVSRVASLIYLEVSGQITLKVNLLGIDSPWFLTSRRLPVEIRLANQGNSHYPARVKQSIKSLFGQESGAIQKDGLILPGTIRKLSSELKTPWFPGIYKLVVQFSPPQGGPVQSYSQTIIYFPIWAWIVVTALILFILFKFLKRKRKSVRYKR